LETLIVEVFISFDIVINMAKKKQRITSYCINGAFHKKKTKTKTKTKT